MDFWQILATFPINPNNGTQIARKSRVALAATILFPPIVISQIACLRAYKIILVAFVFCLTFPRCGFSNVSSTCLPERKHNHIGCICLTSHHYAFWNVSSMRLHKMTQSHTGCSVQLLSSVCFQMCTQIAWIRAATLTLVAFVWLFSTVSF